MIFEGDRLFNLPFTDASSTRRSRELLASASGYEKAYLPQKLCFCSGRWAGIGPALGWCPVFAGRVSTLCWFSVGPCLRRCPGTAPTLGRSWCLLGFTILCNNVDFWLFRSAYMFFFYYIHFGVTYKPKWAGYYIVNIFILSLDLFVHVTITKNIQYNILYNVSCHAPSGQAIPGNMTDLPNV